MNNTGNRLGFALVFTVFAVVFNIYVVLNGSAETFYERVTDFLLSDDDQTAETDLQHDYQLLNDDCTLLAEIHGGTARSTSVSHTGCNSNSAIGI